MAKNTTIDPPDNGGEIIDEPMSEALSKRYLAYALSTITARALPDVRDGLKPVHRRVLYSMSQLGLAPNGSFRKSATVVGEVIGKYHPHGDQSIYDAMVRLAQDFATRTPLVDGQGNFGNIDGDAPAAFRYTEAQLTPAAMLLLEGLDDDAVDFRETYDGQNREPVVLAAGFPNLLANGSSGIAVGMATSIPPHNPAECIDAAIHLLDHPKATVDDLMKIIPGPDFPTGGADRRVEGGPARGLRDGPRRRPHAGALAQGRPWPRHVAHHRHRDSLPGAEIQADGAPGRTDRDQEGAAARRRDGRVDRRRPHRPHAEVARGRGRGADGQPVPAVRAGDALPGQHERARPRRAQGDGSQGDPELLSRSPPRSDRPPCQAPAGEDRAPPGSPGRPAQGLPQHRRSHPDHPLRGRSQGRDDEAVPPVRHPGRSHPQHAPACVAQARRDRDQARAQGTVGGRSADREAARLDRPPVDRGEAPAEGRARDLRSGKRNSATAAPTSARRRRSTPTPRSKRSSSRSRSRSCFPPWAGSARSRATTRSSTS